MSIIPLSFRNSGLLGIAVIAMSVVLMLISPSKKPEMPEGFFTPIIAFEFMQTPQEVQQLFGPPDSSEREDMVWKMTVKNWIDFLYMLLYASFSGLFCVTFARHTHSKILCSGAMLAIVVLLADFLENLQLLGIMAKLPTGQFEQELRLLHLFTWLKWGGLALMFVLLAPYLLQGTLFSKIIGGWGIAAAILAVAAYLHRSVLTEIFCLAVALMFVLLIVWCFKSSRKDAKALRF